MPFLSEYPKMPRIRIIIPRKKPEFAQPAEYLQRPTHSTGDSRNQLYSRSTASLDDVAMQYFIKHPYLRTEPSIILTPKRVDDPIKSIPDILPKWRKF